MPLRLRLMNAMGATCTYIPFLVRWDLVPPWKKYGKSHKNIFPIYFLLKSLNLCKLISVPSPPENENDANESDTSKDGSDDNKNNGDDSGTQNNPDCANQEPPQQEKPLSAFEEGLLDLNPDAMKEINDIRNDPSTGLQPEKETPETKDRGAPVKRMRDLKTKVDIDADFRMGKRVMNADSNVDVISTIEGSPAYSHDMMYHILTYGKDSSKEKEKNFPFHTKRIFVKDW